MSIRLKAVRLVVLCATVAVLCPPPCPAFAADSFQQQTATKVDNLLKQLEDRLADDPYKGLPRDKASKVAEELKGLESKINIQIAKLPADDVDRKAYEKRLADAKEKAEGYGNTFGAADDADKVAQSWKLTQAQFDGSDKEAFKAGRPFAPLKMLKTVQGIHITRNWLTGKREIARREAVKADPKVVQTVADAEKTLGDLQAKWDTAFNAWMDAAEALPRPAGSNASALNSGTQMARLANDLLADSKYLDPDTTRALKLDKKWKDEVDALKAQHADALKKLTDEATTAWPAIDAASGAQDGFNPSDDSARGKTFRFKAVRNRMGWDFDDAYDLVIMVGGQPVAGTYDPKVKAAFADAAKQIGREVDDHIDWEVIAVVDGPGTVNKHYKSEVKGDRAEVLAKTEGYVPVPCTRVKVIAVHAGPVAVTAK